MSELQYDYSVNRLWIKGLGIVCLRIAQDKRQKIKANKPRDFLACILYLLAARCLRDGLKPQYQ